MWSRYPAADVEPSPSGGTLVHFSDVRYERTGRLFGPTVELAAGAVGARQRLTRYSSASLRGGMSSTRSVHCTSGQTCTRDLKRQPSAVFSNVSS